MNFEYFNYLDWGVLGFIGLFFLVGFGRGFGGTFFALIIWGASFIAAQLFARVISLPFSNYFDDPELLLLVPFTLIFLFSMVVLNMIFSVFTFSAPKVGGSLLSARFLGAVLSLPLSFIQLLIAINFSRLLGLTSNPYWRESQLLPGLLQFELLWENSVLKVMCLLIPAAQCSF